MDSLTSSRHDTLATLWFENLAPQRKTLSAGHTLQVAVNLTSLHSSDAAVVTQAGELVVLRGADYTIEWLDAQGSKCQDVRVPSGRQCLDVLNDEGVREVRYRLPERARFLTASNRYIFLKHRDEHDLETVSAYVVR